jgi:hypothetical protein
MTILSFHSCLGLPSIFLPSGYMLRRCINRHYWPPGHAIAQAVGHQLPIAASQVRSQVRSLGICNGQSDSEVGFLQILWFPIILLISHSLIIQHYTTVVENLVKLWRWQSKVIENKWQERNYTVTRRLHV